jgi:hypothetical protein
MDLSYPIGKFDAKQPVAAESVPGLIQQIAAAGRAPRCRPRPR